MRMCQILCNSCDCWAFVTSKYKKCFRHQLIKKNITDGNKNCSAEALQTHNKLLKRALGNAPKLAPNVFL